MATKIAIGIIKSKDRILVGVRPDGGPLAGKHEFPGGKCHADETPRVCVVREVQEETGLMVKPLEHIETVDHEYDHGAVELHFWLCSLVADLPEGVEPRGSFEWLTFDQLAECDFPEANAGVLQKLMA